MDEKQKAMTHGTPGEGARAAGIAGALTPTLLMLFILGLCIGLALPKIPVAISAGAILLATIALVLTARRTVANVENWFKGARGEERVAFFLEDLPAGWHVFHDVVLPDGRDVDHVVIGPNGVFAIETKFWSGKISLSPKGMILADGKEPSRPPIEQTSDEARALAAMFASHLQVPPSCVPVLCFAGGKFSEGRAKVREVFVCNAPDVATLILEQPKSLTVEEIERAAKVLEGKDVR